MSYFNRHIDSILLQWRNDKHHKPLMLRGAPSGKNYNKIKVFPLYAIGKAVTDKTAVLSCG